MTRLRPWLTIGAAGLLAAALVWLVFSEHRARAEGTEVALIVQQVDPRSLLSGHYVQLDFTEPMAPGASCGAPTHFDPLGRGNQEGWVALKLNGDHHRFAGVGRTRAEAAKYGPVQVRGSAVCTDFSDDPRAQLYLGLDRFHAAQKEAEALETLVRDQNGQRVLALVSVGKDGRARLAGLRVDGRDVRLDWFGL
jgi:uncharacterized membrane-anchored protein